ncbi:MAG: hypothetical protein IPF58_18775 [Saprospirales bacterium]|nr:hypothetical protein [Saprospirales bacterium]
MIIVFCRMIKTYIYNSTSKELRIVSLCLLLERKIIFDLAKNKTSNEKIVRIQQQVAELNGNQNTAMKEIVLKVNASATQHRQH